MKRILFVLATLLLLCGSASAQGMLGRLGRSAINAVENSVNRQVEKTVSDAVDKEFDKVRENQRKKAEEAAAETQRQLDSLAQAGVEIDADELNENSGKEAAKPEAKAEEVVRMPANAEYESYARSHGTWFCADKGAKLLYEQMDGDGKKTNEAQYTITDVKRDGSKTVISYDMLIPALSSDPMKCAVTSEGGWFYTDARSMGQVGKDLSIKGNAPIMPEKPSAGLKLQDCTVTIESLATTANYKNIRFTKNEKVTVPAGTFDCWCLEYEVVSKVAILKATSKCEQWFAKDVGVVRYVIKNSKGDVHSVQELVKIEK